MNALALGVMEHLLSVQNACDFIGYFSYLTFCALILIDTDDELPYYARVFHFTALIAVCFNVTIVFFHLFEKTRYTIHMMERVFIDCIPFGLVFTSLILLIASLMVYLEDHMEEDGLLDS